MITYEHQTRNFVHIVMMLLNYLFVYIISIEILFIVDFVHSIITTTKLPAMVLAWENLQEVFVMLVVVVFYLSGGLTFHCFSTIFTAGATVLSGRFLITGVFYPTLLRLWLRWGQEHPIQDPPLFLPAQSCPFQMTGGLELLMFELQDHWFINCASEPRSIELKLNYWISFACSKSYVKTIKIHFEQDLDLSYF